MTVPPRPAEFILPSTDYGVNGVRLRCATFPAASLNGARALLCIPGYAAAGESFARLRPLAGVYDVRLLTLPEEATRHSDPVGEFAGVVSEFARRFDHPLIVGTSFGGLVAMETANRLDGAVAGLVLISTFAMHPRGSVLLRLKWLVSAVEALAPWIEPLGLRIIGGKRIDDAAGLELRQETHAISRREKHARLLASLGADLREVARKLVVPTLIIHGSRDRLVPIETAREMAELMPHAEFVEIAGAGHLPYITHAAEVNAAMLRFCARAFEVEHVRHPERSEGSRNA